MKDGETILAFDSSGACCSAALWAGGRIAARRLEPMSRGQAERLMPMILAAMAEGGCGFADLTKIAVTVGPGSFTGIRVALAAARGLALAGGLPVMGVTTFDAALGHTMGSTVNVSIKSGTNQVHGELHEWFRHSILDAPTIFQNRSGQTPSIYQDNRYGASAGAPVYIPGAYNGKNKTFWFVAYEGNKFGNPDSGGNVTSTVPTAKMHAGDFSEYLALGATYLPGRSQSVAFVLSDSFSGSPRNRCRLAGFGASLKAGLMHPNSETNRRSARKLRIQTRGQSC